ncbi:hypothetical protein, partial [Nitratifractor sp.]
ITNGPTALWDTDPPQRFQVGNMPLDIQWKSNFGNGTKFGGRSIPIHGITVDPQKLTGLDGGDVYDEAPKYFSDAIQ